MASSPRSSPSTTPRPISAYSRQRSSSRMSLSSKQDGSRSTSRSSDEMGKTAVKVVVRVRPPLKPTDPEFDLIPQRFRRSTCQVLSPTTLAVEAPQGKKIFVFDRVFGEEVDQEGIWEYLSHSVSSFVQGYNVSILAYGQSGAGKSYTMGTTGPMEQADPEVMGVIPRAARELFSKLSGEPNGRRTASESSLRTPARYPNYGLPTAPTASAFSKFDQGNWQLTATYVEIYNEQLRDLLVADSNPQSERHVISIREDTKGRIMLTGLKQVQITSVEDLLSALNFGSSIRQTDATTVNSKSSRSHAVFSLNLTQKRKKTTRTAVEEKRLSIPVESLTGAENATVTINSKLHFVDLAGSERLKNTGAQGERAREGISINAGLASLGKVISQLSSRQPGSHVSYRDSRLTRLLQDSLGGNAITYMIACVTPAEFHLSETLNTVQYAQRARAIQSRPQIQQIADDGDKQAAIDRLRAEVAFLRDQIRRSERAERRNNRGSPQEGLERQQEREMELQNQLLSVQENYSALSQRHAKLISEITKARDNEFAETPVLSNAIGESSVERLKRSNSFAEAVEQVVLEYEKTIESLEVSLSKTRSSLSTSESSLLERESRLTYMESVTQQLQARIQKATQREQSNEGYVRQLEARLDGTPNGEDDEDSVVQELRIELTRVRENEASAEDYISTLEERLAEAEQNAEIRQRDIERLESVVERQRSVGKLDSLLSNLDNIQRADSAYNDAAAVHERPSRSTAAAHKGELSHVCITMVNGHSNDFEPNEDMDAQLSNRQSEPEPDTATTISQKALKAFFSLDTALQLNDKANVPQGPQTPAQSNLLADKLETMTQELFDLRIAHEATLTDYDALSQKYHVALQTLAKLQDAVNETPSPSHRTSKISSRPHSIEAHAGLLESEGGQPSSSRSLSSELSSVGVWDNDLEMPDDEPSAKKSDTEETERGTSFEDTTSAQEIDMLKKSHDEKGSKLDELTNSYTELQEKHLNLLYHVEELRSEVVKAQQMRPSTPSPMIRRKASQVIASDRANRSLTMLRNIATENFEGQPDTLQSFVINLNAAATEMQMRSERVAELEAEVAAIRKEMETKTTIISGLTRERSSLKASPTMDMSVVMSMQEKILETESEMRSLHEAHAARERDLLGQIETLRARRKSEKETSESSLWHRGFNGSSPMPGIFPEDSAPSSDDEEGGVIEEYKRSIDELEQKFAASEDRHHAAMEAMQASQQHLLTTISNMESAIKEREMTIKSVQAESTAEDGTDEAQPKAEHQSIMSSLRKEMEEFRDAAAAQASKLTELELSHASLLQSAEDGRSKYAPAGDIQAQLLQHTFEVANYQQCLDLLHQSHANALAGILAALSSAQAETDNRLAELASRAASVEALQHELDNFRHMPKETEKRHDSGVLSQFEPDQRHAQSTSYPDLEALQELHAKELQELRDALSGAQTESNQRIADLTTRHEEALKAQHEDLRMAEGKGTELTLQHREAIESLQKDLATAHAKLAEVTAEHNETIKCLQEDLATAQDELIALLAEASMALNEDTDIVALPQQIKALVRDHNQLFNERNEAADRLMAAQEQLERVEHKAAALQQKVDDLVTLNEETAAELERIAAREEKSSRLVQELEDQLHSNFDQHQDTTRRLSTLQLERHVRLEEANQAMVDIGKELEQSRAQVAQLESKQQQLADTKRVTQVSQRSSLDPRDNASERPASERPSSTATNLRKSVSNTSLPSPPPAFPLPPLPNASSGAPSAPITPISTAHQQQSQMSPPTSPHQSRELAHTQLIDELEARIRTIEKHLFAEKQLTNTLEEALTDLEASNTRTKAEAEAWRKKTVALEEELGRVKKEHKRESERFSLQAVEEERERRLRAEEARQVLEERMKGLEGKGGRGKKRSALNCF